MMINRTNTLSAPGELNMSEPILTIYIMNGSTSRFYDTMVRHFCFSHHRHFLLWRENN